MMPNKKEWGVFKLDELFKIRSGRDIDLKSNFGDIPYINSSGENNGITAFVSNIIKSGENIITVARTGTVGATFYQQGKVGVSGNIRTLELKGGKLNKYLAIFLISSLKKSFIDKFHYGKILGTERLKTNKLLLPINQFGQPDRKFIENYMKDLEKDRLLQKALIYFSNKLSEFHTYKDIIPLQDKKWDEFFIEDLFTNIQRGKRLKKGEHIIGNIPYISSTANNNGTDGFIGNTKNIRVFNNCLTLANSGSVGSTFFQPFSFIASDHVTKLENTSFSKYTYLFIATKVKLLSDKYGFNREINDTRIRREKILLPITKSGDPDYKYMEDYMKQIEYKQIKKYIESKVK